VGTADMNKSKADIHQILKTYWGFDKFRPLQENIIHSILSGQDTLALMPTGGGKSLCYQVPAMAMEGMCLVISPLIALMKDQVENLRKKNITAYSIYSGMQRKEVIRTLETVTESNCKFLFVSPERLETSLFKEYLPGMGINLVAVDEAHCISQWGYDFRPSYLRIAALRDELPGIPVLALTASATKEVQQDICDKLAFINQEIFQQSFERPNLSYSIFKAESKISRIIEIIKKVPGTGIIYCKSRKRTREISELLQLEGISCDFYHAGLSSDERNRKQEDWIQNRTRIIACTNAFGMGIDKPDVRLVVHADVPDCLENYYQEAGRAGRDRKTAYAVLLYDTLDIEELKNLSAQRFPPPSQIKKTYQAVSNYLQIPAGGGEGQYFEFDISDFLKKFQTDSHATLYSLKILEQENWLAFNEQAFLPSSVRFCTSKEYLYEFEKKYPALEIIIKTLLRSYEGIFDQPVFISEKMMAGILRKDADEIRQQLAQLAKAGLIEYAPQKDSPQLLFLKPRARQDEIAINMVTYNYRKERMEQRVGQMIKYVEEESACRSQLIGHYFGDASIPTCGICDNCLRKKSSSMNKEEFETIHHRIVNIVKYEPLPVRDLLSKLSGIKKEKAWKVIEFLQAENKIEMDNSGWIRLV
jgi:ATP-dependent DNA helicase RecQ